jgi:hypothetical protein
MTWRGFRVASTRTHHLRGDRPAYEERFDEVLSFHEPGLAAVRRGAEAWHVDERGRAAYERRFVRTFGFYEERAAVVDRDGSHHIDTGGRSVTPERYAWCGNYQGGRCAVRRLDGRYLHIDLGGRGASSRTWRYVGDYREGLAVVLADDGRSSHVDLFGELAHERWFVDLDVFHKGFARARDAAGWHHIDRSGAPLYSRRFAMVEPFYNGQARVEGLDGAREVIDEAGHRVVSLHGRP